MLFHLLWLQACDINTFKFPIHVTVYNAWKLAVDIVFQIQFISTLKKNVNLYSF